MNEQGLLLLSYALELLALFSVVMGILFLVRKLSDRRSGQPKDNRSPSARLRRAMDEQDRK